jgi:hypothetical protein
VFQFGVINQVHGMRISNKKYRKYIYFIYIYETYVHIRNKLCTWTSNNRAILTLPRGFSVQFRQIEQVEKLKSSEEMDTEYG